MKITTVMGSPKKHGKTATALEFFEKQLLSQGRKTADDLATAILNGL